MAFTMEPRTVEEVDYKAEFEKLQDVVEKQKAEIHDLRAVYEKQQKEIKYWLDKAEKYRMVIKTVEAMLGRNIISCDCGDTECDDYE